MTTKNVHSNSPPVLFATVASYIGPRTVHDRLQTVHWALTAVISGTFPLASTPFTVQPRYRVL